MTPSLSSLWDDNEAAKLSEEELLKYRSNLLGSDLRITNFGGGNTSAKIAMTDPLTLSETDILWVKGSGGDLGSIEISGFSTLYLDKLEYLKNLYQGLDHEDDMVAYLPHCTFNLNSRAASIDTPLHAFIPFPHVDHMHPDAVIAIACTKNSESLTEIIFEGTVGWLPWQRPGFDLALKLEKLVQDNPHILGIVLEGHGLFSWGKSAKSCYLNTLNIINTAADWLAKNKIREGFGGQIGYKNLDQSQRTDIAKKLMPFIRGRISQDSHKVGHFIQSDEVLQFVNSENLKSLAQIGTSCPDHFLRTKKRPLVLNFNADTNNINEALDSCLETFDQRLTEYQAGYREYYEVCKSEGSPALRDPNPVVYLIPGVGMITFAKDKATARIAGEFYINAINVMREANSVSEYVGLNDKEAFNIEYWALEEAKLQRMPKAKSLAGRIAFITGGAGGIGTAIASRFLEEGACVMLADIDNESLKRVSQELSQRFGQDVVREVYCDVTVEESVEHAIQQTSVEFGGIDILVSNAGIASASPLDETSLEVWNKNIGILTTGYFLVSREAFKIMKTQNTGGSIIFVASKNALVASPNASAYCTAKAAELQLARSIALEGAPLGIRCNVVNPDAVLQGSKIWTGKWREERAQAYQMAEGDLEVHYRDRSLLKKNVYPADVANAIYFLACDASSKSTGNIINVDAGHAPSFTR